MGLDEQVARLESKVRNAVQTRAQPHTGAGTALDVLNPSRDSLVAFTEATMRRYRAAPVHRIIAQHLEAVECGEIDRLMIFTPPRHGKSELTSVRFPSWFLGRNPDKRIIAVSHTDRLARSFGRKARNLLNEASYQNIFPNIKASWDSHAASEWNVANHDGGYLAAGIGGPITGYGAHVAIIDDPVKSRKEADSVTYREQTWEWFSDVLATRLEDGGAIILCQTRWHLDDLAGRLLENEPGRWTVLRLPAIAERDDPLGREPGEALWPEKYPIEKLQELQATSVDFDALYQQSPVTRSGAIFDSSWFPRYDASVLSHKGNTSARYISIDTAMKDSSTSDYTACCVTELTPDYRLRVRHVWRERMQFPALVSAITETVSRFNRDGLLRSIIIEDRNSGTSSLQTLRMAAPELSHLLVGFEPQGSKIYRAQQSAIWCKLGSVLLPEPSEHALWLHDFEQELFSMPSVPNDDQVDSLVQCIIWCEHLVARGWHERNAILQAAQPGNVLHDRVRAALSQAGR